MEMISSVSLILYFCLKNLYSFSLKLKNITPLTECNVRGVILNNDYINVLLLPVFEKLFTKKFH